MATPVGYSQGDHPGVMSPSLLLTSCLFQNTPGPHVGLLARAGLRTVPMRGPLPESELIAALGDHDALLCDTDDITAAVLETACPRLKVISKVGASTRSIDLEACKRHGVTVLTTSGVNHHAVAELTIGLILALSRNIPSSAQALRAGLWVRDPGHELRDRRLGVVGLGRVGKEVARLGHAFGMRVAACCRSWPDEFAASLGIERAPNLAALAARSDVLTLHPTLSPETIGMVDAEVLAALPPGALLVNTSRAAVVDSRALLAALESGHLGAYASDVPEPEPPDPDDPLIRHPRTLFTPHTGTFTVQSIPRLLVLAAENLVLFFGQQGQPKPRND